MTDDERQGGASNVEEGKKKQLPPHLELQRTHVACGPIMNAHTRTITSANAYFPLGVDNAWDLAAFEEDFDIKIISLSDEVLVCDIIGIDPSIANALRRILIAEVPTVAIEHVFMVNNTSIVQDEVLSHRLGLVPLKIDPALLQYKDSEAGANEQNTIVFELDVRCYRQGDQIMNEKVLSDQLQWRPSGSAYTSETQCKFAAEGQEPLFGDHRPCPVHDDILLAKMRPGQCIQLEAHAVKGIGKDHAKWSPVATAWYTLLPEVVLREAPDDHVASLLQQAAPGLFTRDASGQLVAGAARDHTKDLEKVRALLEKEEVARVLEYRKKKDHFIFTIESSGVLAPDVLLLQALDILHGKAHRLTTLL